MSNVRSTYTDGISFFGKEDPRELAARFGTPLYVYNENVLRSCCRDLKKLSAHPGFRVNYSAKANTNVSIMRIIREEGCVIDAMSPGELHTDRIAGFTPSEITYISNNISREEMKNAIDNGVLMSVDSVSQLEMYGQLNPGGKVMVRFNPGIGAGHHSKVVTAGKETKFGVTPDLLETVYTILDRYNLTLAGVNQHIGSLFMTPDGYIAAAEVLLNLAEKLPPARMEKLEVIDFGGGFGIPYRKYDGEARLDMEDLGNRLHSLISSWSERTGYKGKFFVEPGRYTVAECGILLGGVHCVKNNGENRYVGTDIGFNVLVRPAMYDSFHDVEIYRENGTPDTKTMVQSITGNICESGDVLVKKRELPEMKEGDILGILDAGAYGYVMSSPYNQRLRPAEVLIGADGKARLIRRRETFEDLLRGYEGIE